MSTALARTDRRSPILWWVAGADADVLSKCPRGDQIFVQHLALSLIAAFLFVLFISTVSIFVAFPDLSTTLTGMLLAPAFALLIACTVFLIDRLFIQSDWDYQASRQRQELAEAAWEKAPIEKQMLERALNARGKIFQIIKRAFLIAFRVLLSAAIGLTIASFLELVIYKDEIRTLIQRLHYEENKGVYDEIRVRTAAFDEEIDKARSERNRLLGLRAGAEAELTRLQLLPPPVPSDKTASDIDTQENEIRSKIAREESKVRQFNEDMIAETRGTQINPWNSGLVGYGPKYQTANDLKLLSEAAIARLRKEIESLETQKKAAIANRSAELEEAKSNIGRQRDSLRAHISELAALLSVAQSRFSELEKKRDPAIEDFTSALKAKPDFIPISFGVASQFRALRTLYAEYGSTFEMYMVKLLIMLLEMTPVLQKWFMSPTTLYAARLDAVKRFGAYDELEEALRRKQEHIRNKAFAEKDEQLEEQIIERLRRSNVTPLHERQGLE